MNKITNPAFIYILVKCAPILIAAEQSHLNITNLLLQLVNILKRRMFANTRHSVGTLLEFYFYWAPFNVHDGVLLYLK